MNEDRFKEVVHGWFLKSKPGGYVDKKMQETKDALIKNLANSTNFYCVVGDGKSWQTFGSVDNAIELIMLLVKIEKDIRVMTKEANNEVKNFTKSKEKEDPQQEKEEE